MSRGEKEKLRAQDLNEEEEEEEEETARSRIRDSGVAVSFQHDNTIVTDSDEENEEDVPEIQGPEVPEDPEEEDEIPDLGQLFPIPEEDEQPNMAEPVTPSQLSALPTFDGERGEGFVNWLERLEVAQTTYRWTEDSLVQVAKAKGGAKVAEWDRGNRLRGQVRERWAGAQGFRQALYNRFGPKYTSATAVNAVADLKMKPKESCATFLDRVVLAVDKQHFNVTAEQKREAGYRAVAEAAIMSHFGAGLREDIKKTVLGAANPPDTVDGMLAAAEAIEAELAKTGAPGASALAVQADVCAAAAHNPNPPANFPAQPDEDSFGYEESLSCLDAKVEELVAAVQRFRRKPLDRSKIQCYNCHKFGHFRNECKEPLRPSGGRGSATPGGYQRRPSNYAPNPGNRWRSQNVVEPGPQPGPSNTDQATPEGDEQYNDQEDFISGNF